MVGYVKSGGEGRMEEEGEGATNGKRDVQGEKRMILGEKENNRRGRTPRKKKRKKGRQEG